MSIIRPDTMFGVLWHTIDAYVRNFQLLLTVSLPFLIVFPLALFLPNFTALGGIFLRFGSISRDVSLFDVSIIAIAFAISLLLFSFALVAINMVIKTERTLNKIRIYDFEKIEQYTLKLFSLFFVVFVLSLAANMLLYEYGLHTKLGALVSFVLSLAVVFAPQAIVIDGQHARHAPKMSFSIISRKFPLFLSYVIIAVLLLLVNAAIFLSIAPAIGVVAAQLLTVVVNALLVIPFLEVLKTQVYLSKYTLM